MYFRNTSGTLHIVEDEKIKIMASSPITSGQIDGETMETVTDFILGTPKSLHPRKSPRPPLHLKNGPNMPLTTRKPRGVHCFKF